MLLMRLLAQDPPRHSPWLTTALAQYELDIQQAMDDLRLQSLGYHEPWPDLPAIDYGWPTPVWKQEQIIQEFYA